MAYLLGDGCAKADDSFGPVVPPSCRAFDFTLLFEQIFLSLLPATAFCVAALYRLWRLRHTQSAVPGLGLQAAKQLAILCHACTQLAILILWSTAAYKTDASLASAVATFLTSLLLCPLSYFEGNRSARPSAALNLYLLGSLLFDTVQVRTLWLAGLSKLGITSSVALGVKSTLILLEALPKKANFTQNGPNTSREDQAGIYSLRTFWWINKILLLGRRQRLELANLDFIGPGLKTARYSSRLVHNLDSNRKNAKYGLVLAVFSTLKWPLLAPAFPRLILIGFNFAQPLLIKRAINFVDRANDPSNDANVGYGLIGATVLVYTGLAIFNGYYGHLLYRSIILVRGALVDIIYQKSLDVELSVAQKAAPAGLVTADVERIDFTIEKLHSVWASIVELSIGVYLLSIEVGWACIAPALVALTCTIATSFISKMLPARLKAWNQQVQKRVALTSTMLSNMKTAKMMGFSKHIATTLQTARMVELAASAGFRRCMAVVNTIVLVPRQISAPFTLTLFVLAVSHGTLSPSRAFTALSLIEIITTPLTLLLQALPSITASLGCLDRIQEYLKSPDKLDFRMADGSHAQYKNEKVYNTIVDVDRAQLDGSEEFAMSTEKHGIVINDAPVSNVAISFKDVNIFSEAAATGTHLLGPISWTVPRGSITLVVGPSGSGKSSLLKAILGEMNVQGEVYVRPGPIAYCDQTAWLPNESIRNCIVGMNDNSKFDSAWYDEVVHTCALGEDGDLCSQLSGTDAKVVGSRGMTLSEGQKQRLTLARALYSRSPLLVFDDIFRSLDLQTEMLISERLLSPIHGLLKRHGMTAIFATHSMRQVSVADEVIVLRDGKLTRFDDLQKLDGHEEDVPDRLAVQLDCSVKVETAVPDKVATGTTAETAAKASKESKILSKNKTTGPSAPAPGARVVGNRGKSTYRFYLQPVGRVQIGVLLTAVILLAFSTRFQRVWVGWWTNSVPGFEAMYIGVYFLLAVGACMSFMFFFWWMFVVVVPVTAGDLHERLLRTILNAPLSYFTTTDSGVILNRFSQDMAMVNTMLPVAVFQATSSGVMVLSQIATVAYGARYMAVSIPVTLIALGVLAQFYLLTSQQLRILDIELKAPIYTVLTETKEGLMTIRALGWQAAYKRHCQAKVDESKRAIYMLFMVQRWLNFVLDLIVAGLATLLIVIATQLRNSVDAAALGVGLSSIIGFSTITSQFIMAYTELENSLGAVARIEECVNNIQSEDANAENSPAALQEPSHDWPRHGEIRFSHVTAVYDDSNNPALSDVSFRASPGQKVLVCGRTGSGKSTLILALLRLVDLHGDNSQILIDGTDISGLRAEAVRQRLAVIPQTPFMVPGSVRLNLCASWSGAQSEEAMVTALTKVGLWDLISERGGLEADMTVIALSHGQQQLFAMAMAMLRKQKGSIVVMDEATSGVDDETERKIYEVIEDEFHDCTVIMVAHRLKPAARVCDLVIVLSGGKCVEMGHPRDLEEAKGQFFRLLQV